MTRSFNKFTARLGTNGLRADIEKRALRLHVSLQDLYEGPRTPSVINARRAIYGWLTAKKKMTHREIARIFDREPTSVWKLTRKSP